VQRVIPKLASIWKRHRTSPPMDTSESENRILLLGSPLLQEELARPSERGGTGSHASFTTFAIVHPEAVSRRPLDCGLNVIAEPVCSGPRGWTGIDRHSPSIRECSALQSRFLQRYWSYMTSLTDQASSSPETCSGYRCVLPLLPPALSMTPKHMT